MDKMKPYMRCLGALVPQATIASNIREYLHAGTITTTITTTTTRPPKMFGFLTPSKYQKTNRTIFSLPTALILIDNQAAFAHPTTTNSTRSNPVFEVNLTSLLAAFRVAREASLSSVTPPPPPPPPPPPSSSPSSSRDKQAHLEIVHIFHTSDSPSSPLHPHHPGNGMRPLDFACPLPPPPEDKETNGDIERPSYREEKVFWKPNTSNPIGPDLESHLRQRGFQQLLFAGLTTDHCVSATVRAAADLGIVEPGRIILVADATATWAKEGVDAETVHAGSVAGLENGVAEVMGTEDVVKALRRVK